MCASDFKYAMCFLAVRTEQKANFEISSSAFASYGLEKCPSFSTASGKTIKLDEKSLLEARKLFDDFPANCLEENIGSWKQIDTYS